MNLQESVTKEQAEAVLEEAKTFLKNINRLKRYEDFDYVYNKMLDWVDQLL